MSVEDEVEDRDESEPPPSHRPRASSVLLVVALTLVALFWATAASAKFFVDWPFSYTYSTEWVQNLAESTARFPRREESGLYFVACVFLVPALVLSSLWVARRFGDPLARLSQVVEATPSQLAVVAAVVAAAGAAFVAFGLIQGAHLIDDERAYAFQAETFAKGHLALPAAPNAFRNAMLVTRPVWAAKYPPGHALVLLPGVLLGEPHVMPILITALTVLGVYQLARIFGERQALLAAALYALSPFVWAVGATLMAFSTNTCALVWFFAALARSENTPGAKYPALAGALLGLAALTRPFDAVALALPAMGWLGWRAAKREPAVLRRLFVVVLAVVPFAAFQLFYNRALTGSVWTFPYFLTKGFNLGFTRTIDWLPYVHNPLQAAGHLAVAAMRLDAWLLAFPASLLLVLLGLLRPNPRAWDRVLGASLLSFVLFYTLVPSSGTWDVGPTYYHVCAPLLVVIAVRGVHGLREACSERWPALASFGSAFVVTGPVIALTCIMPLHFVRLALLSGEIRAPWEAIARSSIGEAVVVVPVYAKRFAAGYALGYPYEIPTGPTTRAHLVWPSDASELDEARKVLGESLPVYSLKVDRDKFEAHAQRQFALVPVGPEFRPQ